jgi:phosphoribosylformylglycinamidine cyclo-ligase
MAKKKLTYQSSGVDIDLYEQSLAGMIPFVKRTHSPRVLDGFGGFASLFSLDYNCRLFAKNYRHPVLVTCTDGVGSKLKIACLTGKYDTVGIDLVAMSVNDLICTGGEPLVFLDYIAMPQDDTPLSLALIKGISDGCKEAECSLVGGELAILPDFYQPGDFDMAGFATGVVERERIVDGRHIQTGDAIIGLASSGIHSNGYSLVRKIVFEAAGLKVADAVPELGGTVGEVLLTPTRIYARPIRQLVDHYPVKKRVIRGLANITGGGLPDNVARILPPGKRVHVKRGSWGIPPVFTWLQKLGNVADQEMFRVFNMGVGFVVICAAAAADGVIGQLSKDGVAAWKIGNVTEGEVGVDVV